MVRGTSTDAYRRCFRNGSRVAVLLSVKLWSEVVNSGRLQPLLDGHATPDHHCQNIVRVAVAVDESA